MRIKIDDTSELEVHGDAVAVAVTGHIKGGDYSMRPTSTVSIPRSVLSQVIAALQAEVP